MADMDDLFALMHENLGQQLLERIKSGEATSADLSVARQFLKDNGIVGLPKRDNALGGLQRTLPDLPTSFEDEDGVTYAGGTH